MKTHYLTLFIFFALILSNGCSYDDTLECKVDNSEYSFETVSVETAKYCQSCHSGPSPSGGFDITDYDQVYERIVPCSPEESLLYTKITSGSMKTNSNQEIETAIYEWILAGGAETGGNVSTTDQGKGSNSSSSTSGGSSSGTTTTSNAECVSDLSNTYNFQTVLDKTTVCQTCHSGSSPAASFDITDYNAVLERVVPCDYTTGKLIEKISPGGSMANKDTEENMQALRNAVELWIRFGAVE